MPGVIRLLLIEDNRADAVLMQDMLLSIPSSSYRVTWEDRLAKGLARLEETSFDAAMLDLSLPDSHGLETLSRLLAAAENLPVVVITGLEDEATAQSAIRQGAQDYLVKGTFTGRAAARVIQYAIDRKHTALALRDAHAAAQAAQAARDAIAAMAEGVLHLDMAGNVLSLNPALERLSGYCEGTQLGRNVVEVFPEVFAPEELPRALETFDHLRKGRLVPLSPFTLRTRDGRQVPVAVSASFIHDADGKPDSMIVTVRDITALRQAQSRDVIISTLLGLFIGHTTRGEYLDAVVQHVRDWSGCTCVGIRVLDGVRDCVPYAASVGFESGFMHAEDRLSVQKCACACLRILSAASDAGERSLLTPGGAFVSNDLPLTFADLPPGRRRACRDDCLRGGLRSLAAVPIRYGGKALGIVHLADVRPERVPPETVSLLEVIAPLIGEAIHRFDVEEELRRSEAKYRELVQNANSIIMRRTPDGVITFFNEYAQTFFGYAEADIVGHNVVGTIVPPVDATGRDLGIMIRSIGEHPESYASNENENMRKDGTRVWVQWTNRALRNAQGAVVEILCVGNDASERRRAQQERLRYEERLRSLANKLAASEEEERRRLSRHIHDTVIQGLSLSSIKLGGVLASGGGTLREEERTKLLTTRELIAEAIGQCRQLMSDLTPPMLYELGLEPALESLAEKLRRQHGLAIDIEDDGSEKPMNNALRGLLFQATRELIVNALKHAGPCRIRVALTWVDRAVRICVADDGAGFDPINRPFQSGTTGGFGLFNLRERVEGLGGRFEIASSPGSGTQATIVAPLD